MILEGSSDTSDIEEATTESRTEEEEEKVLTPTEANEQKQTLHGGVGGSGDALHATGTPPGEDQSSVVGSARGRQEREESCKRCCVM